MKFELVMQSGCLHEELQPTMRIHHQVADLELGDPNSTTTMSSQVGCRGSQRGSSGNFPELAEPKKFLTEMEETNSGGIPHGFKGPANMQEPKANSDRYNDCHCPYYKEAFMGPNG